MSEITNETSGEGTLTNNIQDYGSSPSKLYGTFTWKIEKFTQINEREIRSNAFEIGGHSWYLLVYPRGCGVTNHLSLFLCVANYEKLHPGWSHLALFTVAVKHKNPKKSKSSDTFHQFWKKEHDWGWKQFIELPRLHDGFIDKFGDLVFKAQVQVIRECVNRPFPCIKGRYRKELVRVYFKSVEEKLRSFLEEKRSKFVKLFDDRKRWRSLCAFWLKMKPNSRLEMSRENKDVILKLVVKHFFIKNELTSTLVMDFLFYGLKSLEENKSHLERLVKVVVKELFRSNQVESAMKSLEEYTKNDRENDDKELALSTLDEDETKTERTTDAKKFPAVIANVENDMCIVKEPMLLLKRFVLAPLPEMGSPNLVQLRSAATQHDMETDEKQLADFGRWALEVFVLDHIFCNKIEFAYEDAIALEKQEELIHEEEIINKVKKCFVGKKT